MKAYGKSKKYSQKLDGQACRLNILEDQLEDMAVLDNRSH